MAGENSNLIDLANNFHRGYIFLQYYIFFEAIFFLSSQTYIHNSFFNEQFCNNIHNSIQCTPFFSSKIREQSIHVNISQQLKSKMTITQQIANGEDYATLIYLNLF